MIDGDRVVAAIGLAATLVLFGVRLRGTHLASGRIIKLGTLWVGIVMLVWSIVIISRHTA